MFHSALKKTLSLALPLLSAPLALYPQTSRLPDRPILMEHVTVIDPTGSPPRPNVSVLIVDGRIKSISPSTPAKLSPNTITIQAKGKFLIPGLWDMHVHALSKGEPEHFFPLFIANGITGIRDMGGDIPLKEIAQIKAEIAGGSRLGPEISAAGPILEGERPFWSFSIPVKNEAEARRATFQLVEQGADFLKIYNTLSRDAYLAIAAQAKELRVPFVGHIPDSVTPAEASQLGQKSIEHLWGIPPYLIAEPGKLKTLSAEADNAQDPKVAQDLYYRVNQMILCGFDAARASRLYAQFVRNKTWQTPTLVVLRSYAAIHDAELRQDPRMVYVTDDLRKFWNSMGGSPDPRNDAIQGRLFEHDIEIVRAMHAAGVPLLAGTDTPNPYTYPGFSLPEELQLLVSAGLSPYEALQTATLRAAEFLGVAREFGSVESGKVANLVLLDANPLDDIANVQKIRAVILRGRYLDRPILDDLLAKQRVSETHP